MKTIPRAVRRAALLALAASVAWLLPSASALSSASSAAAAAPAAEGRVIFLGFDGADARTAKELMEAGQLPNLSRLAEKGTFAPLGTTNPAESPVCWAALNSGRNPAETGIVGFVRRDFLPGIGPMPKKGLSEDGVAVPIEELELGGVVGKIIHTDKSATMHGLVVGGLALGVFLVLFGLLLRLKAVPTILLSVALAGVGFFAVHSARASLPDTLPVVKNPNVATPFWELAAAQGIPSVALCAGQAWDREPVEDARVLCGLGVPDARGDYISYFVYTTDELYFHRDVNDGDTDTSSGGKKIRVDETDGVIESVVLGPVDFVRVQALEKQLEERVAELEEKRKSVSDYKQGQEISDRIKAVQTELEAELEEAEQAMTLPLRVVRGEGQAEVTLGDQTQTLREGEWSDWYHLRFDLSSSLVQVHAITRARLVSLDEPHFELYLNAIEIDPAHPPFWQPISQPAGFSRELVELTGGPFETVGWSCMTHPFKDGVIDPVPFMEDIEFTMKWRENMTFTMLARDDWRLLVSLLSSPDRVQHMMYQYYDDQHPLYDAEQASRTMTFFGEEIELRDAIPAIYRQIDRIVGRVMDEILRPEDTLLVGADHGFQSFRRQVHINNWLAEHGYLTYKSGTTSSKSSMVHSYVDWSKTQAYSMGLGTVYLNLKGREPAGIVDPAEADALMAKMRTEFLASEDPDHPGTPIGSEVYFAKDVHSGEFLELDADMFFCFAPSYRSSWYTASGGLRLQKGEDGSYGLGATVVDNDRNWSGDHVSVDPEHVKGIFFSSRPIVVPEGGADLLHIAPTVLSLLGVEQPADIDVPALQLP